MIPFAVRDHHLFQAVHEDRIFVNHQGRIQDAHFSGVLSPSHNLSANILGPLLDSVQQRRNAALLLCMPASGESTEAAMLLYSNFLPLLFRAAVQCSIAHVAVVEIRKDGRQMTDVLRNSRPATLSDLETEEVLRANSTSHWGDVMEKLSQRCFSPNAGSESSLFVRIELENYCEVILGDIGYSQEALNIATLVLRSEGHGGSKTSPPHVPFTTLLSGVIPPRGLVHLVCIPDPVNSITFSMRLIHFVSSFERGPAVLDLSSGRIVENENISAKAPVQTGNSPTARTRDTRSVTGSKRFSLMGEDYAGDQWRNEFLVDFDTNMKSSPTRQGHSVPPSAGRAVSAERTKMMPQRRTEIRHDYTESVLNKQQGQTNDTTKQVRSLQEEFGALKAALHESQAALAAAQSKLLLQDRQLTKASSETENMSELINKLLKRLTDLESVQGKDHGWAEELKSKNEQLSLRNATLSAQMNDCLSELRMMKKRETNRVRASTLNNIDSLSPMSGRQTTPQGGSKAATPQGGSKKIKKCILDDELNPAAAVAVKQLREKAENLEMENRELRLKLEHEEAYRKALSPLSKVREKTVSSVAGDSIDADLARDQSSTPSGKKISEFLEREYNTLKQQVAYFTAEVARVQQEKDSLQRIVTTHPRSVEPSDGVNAVVSALTSGCDSLLTQIDTLIPKTNEEVAAHHSQAIHGLKNAVQDIASRRSTGSSAIPHTAASGDCELMSHYLTFEIERLSHLRAFMPSFAQLCAGVERLKMSSRSARGSPGTSF